MLVRGGDAASRCRLGRVRRSSASFIARRSNRRGPATAPAPGAGGVWARPRPGRRACVRSVVQGCPRRWWSRRVEGGGCGGSTMPVPALGPSRGVVTSMAGSRSKQAQQGGGVAMAQHGLRATREDRGHVARVRQQRWVPDGVAPRVHAMQALRRRACAGSRSAAPAAISWRRATTPCWRAASRAIASSMSATGVAISGPYSVRFGSHRRRMASAGVSEQRAGVTEA